MCGIGEDRPLSHSVTGKTLSDQLRDPGDAYIDVGDLIPGGEIRYSGLGQAENGLEFPDRGSGVGAVEAIGSHPGYGSVDGGDGV